MKTTFGFHRPFIPLFRWFTGFFLLVFISFLPFRPANRTFLELFPFDFETVIQAPEKERGRPCPAHLTRAGQIREHHAAPCPSLLHVDMCMESGISRPCCPSCSRSSRRRRETSLHAARARRDRLPHVLHSLASGSSRKNLDFLTNLLFENWHGHKKT